MTVQLKRTLIMKYTDIVNKIVASGIAVRYQERPRVFVGGKRISAAAYANISWSDPYIVMSKRLSGGGDRAIFILLHELAHITAIHTGRDVDEAAEECIADTIATQLFNDILPNGNIKEATRRMSYEMVDFDDTVSMIEVVRGYHKAREILELK